MAMPQRDNYIDQIQRLEGLMAYAEQQQDWDSPLDDFAAINCIQLGITPSEADLKYTGDILTLKFKNPTVTIIAVDFVAGTITGKVIPAEGTRVTVPPMPHMFGLTEVYGIGTAYQGTREYGDNFSLGEVGFSVDLSNYVASNGVFTLHFPEWVARATSRCFSKFSSRSIPMIKGKGKVVNQ